MELEVYDAGEYIGYVIIEPDILKTQLIELIDTKLQDGTLVTILHVFGMKYGIVIKNQEIANNLYNYVSRNEEDNMTLSEHLLVTIQGSGPGQMLATLEEDEYLTDIQYRSGQKRHVYMITEEED